MGLVVSCMKFSKIKCFEHWRTGHQQHPGGGGGYLEFTTMRMCCRVFETLDLFQTKRDEFGTLYKIFY